MKREEVEQLVNENIKLNSNALHAAQVGHLLLIADLTYILMVKGVLTKDEVLMVTRWMEEKPDGVDQDSYEITKKVYENFQDIIKSVNIPDRSK